MALWSNQTDQPNDFLEKCGDYNQTESVSYYQTATFSPDDYSYYETITSDGGISVSTNDDAQGILLVLKVCSGFSIEFLKSGSVYRNIWVS